MDLHFILTASGSSADWSTFLEPIATSLKVSIASGVLVFLGAAVVAWRMSRRSFRGKLLLETVILLPLVLPPTVVGFVLLAVFGRSSWTGKAIEAVFGASPVFTATAAVIAAMVVSFPLVYQAVKSGFQSVDSQLEEAARSMGANEWQVFRWITLPLSGRALVSGFVLGYARGLGEFGATYMFAGNIPGRTQTLPTAVYLAVETGRWGMAWMWCAVMVAISMLMLYAVSRLNRR
ncbi:molybdate ABC transporter permease subunit [Xylanibacillus composti]|uniref:Molybdenum transport system permease n=1 Tax=Xylanibacillus composti TaxID=1572762 RepID=A0A8J4H2B9_9BACL|nr:molybdate ABC transporter permease subunit [Xylanibacillus composti]MDT9724906.1 molybdate ABC transporter permease subunit [Xylanibacillus composti]GIQ68141.1 molybdenum ABC transporter permease subunit [Xylanibacillus composti]